MFHIPKWKTLPPPSPLSKLYDLDMSFKIMKMKVRFSGGSVSTTLRLLVAHLNRNTFSFHTFYIAFLHHLNYNNPDKGRMTKMHCLCVQVQWTYCKILLVNPYAILLISLFGKHKILFQGTVALGRAARATKHSYDSRKQKSYRLNRPLVDLVWPAKNCGRWGVLICRCGYDWKDAL